MVGPGGTGGHRPSALCTVLPTLCFGPLGKDPWKLTWVGLLLLSNLFQAAQQGIDVGLDLRQLCLDGLQLTALYWSGGSIRLSPGSLILTQDPSPILSSRKRGQWQELSLPMAFSGQGKGQSCLWLPPETF